MCAWHTCAFSIQPCAMTTAVLDNPLWSSLSTLHRSRRARERRRASLSSARSRRSSRFPDAARADAGALEALVAPDETADARRGASVPSALAAREPRLNPADDLRRAARRCARAANHRRSPSFIGRRCSRSPRSSTRTTSARARRSSAAIPASSMVTGSTRCSASAWASRAIARISAVCTHPNHVGSGLARHLLAHASNRLFEAHGARHFSTSARKTSARSGSMNRTVTVAGASWDSGHWHARIPSSAPGEWV